MPWPRWKIAAARVELPAILLVACIAVGFVHPFGDFPLNDDENHAIGTWNFVHLGRFVFAIDTTPPLRAQVLWGALWTKLFGESFDVLRASTLVLAGLTLILVNRLLAGAGVMTSLRVVATLAFFFDPLFFWSAHTYMTEVPYICASALALYCFVHAFEQESLPWMAGGCIAVAISWWIRQGIVNIFPPMILLLVYRHRICSRWRLFASLTILTALAYAAMWFTHPEWLVASLSEFATHYKMWNEPTFRLPEVAALFAWYLFYDLQTLAIALLPMAAAASLLVTRFRNVPQRLVLAAFAAFMFAGVTTLVHRGVSWPYYTNVRCCEITRGNIISNFGLGPPTLVDVWAGVHEYPFHLTFGTRALSSYAAALIAAVAFAALAVQARSRFADVRRNLLFVLGSVSALVGAAALGVAGQYFDRYALDAAWPVALLLPLIIDWSNVRFRLVAIALLVVVAAFSIFAVQEYFAWNRARWAAYWQLRNAGVAVKQIDGGAEPYLFFEMSKARTALERRKMAFGGGSREYVLAFAPMPGYRVVASHAFSGWLGMHRGSVVTLRRVSGTSD